MRRFVLASAVLSFLTLALSVPSAAEVSWIPADGLTPRDQLTAVLDPVRNQILAYGGKSLPINPGGGFLNDLWVRSTVPGSEWQQLNAPGAPYFGRYGHGAIYDPVRDRMLVIGGYTSVYGNSIDVWALSLSGAPAWTQLFPSGPWPAGRSFLSAAYDPVRDRVLIFGGDSGSPRNDVWALSLSGTPAWSQITPLGAPPVARAKHAMAYDPVRDAMMIVGGLDGSLTTKNDVWRLSLSGTPAWSQVAPAGATLPPVQQHSLQYDSVRDRMVLFGGVASGIYLDDLWALALATPAWSDATPSGGPSPRAGHASIYDAAKDALVLVGGTDSGGNLTDALWELPLASPSWNYAGNIGIPPARRHGAVAFHDPSGDRMIVHGGGYLDTWALPLNGTGAWQQVQTTGSAPGSADAGAYDSVRDRLIVFQADPNLMWQLDFSVSPAHWSEVLLPSPPTSERLVGAAMVYDPTRDALWLWGGQNHGGLFKRQLGAPNEQWESVGTTGNVNHNLRFHTLLYDPVADRLLAHGGVPGDTDVWSLSLSAPNWTSLAVNGTTPVKRRSHFAVFDAVQNRMLVFGGYDVVTQPGDNVFLHWNDVRALSFGGGSATWSDLTPPGPVPSARYGSAGIWDPTRQQLVLFGGTHLDLGPFNDTWILKPEATVSVGPDARVSALSLAPSVPNPVRTAAQIPFAIPARGDVMLQILDVQGRIVRAFDLRGLEAGPHSITWDGGDATGRRTAPGVYFTRISMNGEQQTRRMVRVW